MSILDRDLLAASLKRKLGEVWRKLDDHSTPLVTELDVLERTHVVTDATARMEIIQEIAEEFRLDIENP